MNIEDYREYCLSLGTDVEEKLPFQKFKNGEGVLVFYVSGHMFSFFDCNDFSVISLKCQPERIEELKAQFECIGNPYNESAKHWIGITPVTAPDDLLKELTRNSYEIVKAKYKKKNEMKIIFLDFDGVMDTAYYDHILSKEGLPGNDSFGTVFDPCCVRNLSEIIEKTGADIVVSSSWKYFMSYKDFLDMWEYRGLPGFVTDITPTPDVRKNRGDEIDAWLDECDVECQYVIIDDLDGSNFNEHHLPKLLVVNPFIGLDEEIAASAIAILNQEG